MAAPSSRKTLISIVAPVFNEVELVDEYYRRTRDLMDAIDERNFELILVDDGCGDGSYQKMEAIAASDPRVRLVKLSRNFGHQIAITAGVDYAVGDAVVVMDSDLQDPPEVIERFLEKWEEGFDVVYGLREEREGESAAKLITASLFYRILRSFTQIDIPADVGDFRLMSGRAAAYFRQLREKDRFVRGLVSWIGFSQTAVSYPQDPRFAGETKYPYRKMIRFALDGITSFSSVPLRFASWLGYLASILAFLYLGSVFVQKALGHTVPGFATIMVAMLFLGGVQLISLGVIGEYIGRIYNEIKARPLYIVEEVRGELSDNRSMVDPLENVRPNLSEGAPPSGAR
jgi:glycosyltransferase involved in cell wall biosynthesis